MSKIDQNHVQQKIGFLVPEIRNLISAAGLIRWDVGPICGSLEAGYRLFWIGEDFFKIIDLCNDCQIFDRRQK